MKIKTSELTGAALNWAVRYALNGQKPLDCVEARDNYSTCWNKGGPLIEREKIETYWHRAMETWAACHDGNLRYGHTLLVAAMRCFVSSKLGDEVEIPSELINA